MSEYDFYVRVPHHHAFTSAMLKVQRANHHINEIIKLLRSIHENAPQSFFAADTPEGDRVNMMYDFGYFLRFTRDLDLMTGDAIHNLRTALDHLAWTIVQWYEPPPNYLYFPIDGELNSLIKSTSYRIIERVAPEIASIIINDVKPYGDGNPFVKLNKLDRADKHRSLIAGGVTSAAYVAVIKNDDDMPDEPPLDGLIIVAPGRLPKPGTRAAAHNEKSGKSTFSPVFTPGLPFGGEPIVPTLVQLLELVGNTVKIIVSYCQAKHDAPYVNAMYGG